MCDSVRDGGRRCEHDPRLHALRARLYRATKRGDVDDVRAIAEEVTGRRAEVAVARGLEPLRPEDPFATREIKLSGSMHDAIRGHVRERAERGELAVDDVELARRIHARAEQTRAAALADPRLYVGADPDVLRLAMRDPDPAVSRAAYLAAERVAHAYRDELVRTPQQRAQYQLSVTSPEADLLAWQAQYRGVAYVVPRGAGFATMAAEREQYGAHDPRPSKPKPEPDIVHVQVAAPAQPRAPRPAGAPAGGKSKRGGSKRGKARRRAKR